VTSESPPRLLDQVREVIRMRHYSIRTEQAYVQWIRRFILFHGKRHPRDMGAPELTAFLSDLALQRNVAASTQNQALHAILFLYRDVLKLVLPWLDQIARAKKPQRLPVVFTREEVKALLAQLQGTTWLMAMLTYGSGLRLLECLRLRVKDVDFHYKQLMVRDAKGQKDRVTMLPHSLIDPMRTHLARVRQLHEIDLREGFGRVYLPHALATKYPTADREWAWQYVFPSSRRSLLRDTLAGVGIRHSYGAGIARPRGREDHDDLHPRPESRRARCGQPRRRALRRNGYSPAAATIASRFLRRICCRPSGASARSTTRPGSPASSTTSSAPAELTAF
jgi:integron integrase